jgi:hypothetical protein
LTVANLRSFEERFPERRERTYTGIVVAEGSSYAINVNGNVLPARWGEAISVQVGMPVLVQLGIGRNGQGEATVLQALTLRPRPVSGTVTVVPVSSQTISVSADGITYTAKFIASYTPVVNDVVSLTWNAGQPTVTGKYGGTVAPPPPPPPPAPVPPPPAPPQTGTTTYAAQDSDTYWGPGGWGSWAGGGKRVYEGDYGSGNVYGAWFYHGGPTQLAGRTITRIRFQLGSRLAVGSYNSGLMIHFYYHTAMFKPGGDVNRIAGPLDHWVNPGQGLTTYDLDVGWAGGLLGGGGIGIALNPYAGFEGILRQPDSGKLIFDWSK